VEELPVRVTVSTSILVLEEIVELKKFGEVGHLGHPVHTIAEDQDPEIVRLPVEQPAL